MQNASLFDSLTTDPNENYNILHNIIQHTNNKHTPLTIYKAEYDSPLSNII